MSEYKMYSLDYEINSFSLEEGLRVRKIVTEAMRDDAKCREIWKACETTGIFLWDDYREDLVRFSSMFPEVLFILDIAGFESYDIERVYFQGGRTQKAMVDIQYSDPNDLDWGTKHGNQGRSYNWTGYTRWRGLFQSFRM